MSQLSTKEAQHLANVLWGQTIPQYKSNSARIARLNQLLSEYDSAKKLQDFAVGDKIKANKSSSPVSEETFQEFRRLLGNQLDVSRVLHEADQARKAAQEQEKAHEGRLRQLRNDDARNRSAANRAARCVESASEGKQEVTGRVSFAGSIWQWIGKSCKGDHAVEGGSKHKTRRKKKHRRKRKTRRTHKKKRMTKRRRKKRTKRKTRKH